MLDAHLHLLDRQVLDRDGTPVTTVDDLELDGIELGARIEPGSPAPTVAAILTGPQLLMRIFGGHAPPGDASRSRGSSSPRSARPCDSASAPIRSTRRGSSAG